MFGVLKRYYDKRNTCVALISVIKVTAQRTVKKKTTTRKQESVKHHDKTEWEQKEKQVVGKREEEVESEMFTAYQIIAENVDEMGNTAQTIIQEEQLNPIRYYLVDYLRQAITVEWNSERKITKVVFRRLDDWEVRRIIQTYRQLIDDTKASLALSMGQLVAKRKEVVPVSSDTENSDQENYADVQKKLAEMQ